MMKTNTLRNHVYCLLFLVGLLSGPQASAQTFSAMLVGGFNLSQIDGDKLGGFNKIGFNTGARVSAKLSDRWSLSTEFLYSQQGASRVPTDDISSQYDKIRLNFVEVPLMINFSDWKILASAGVSYNRLINYEVINDVGSDISELEDYRTDIPSIVLGATYIFSEKLALNFRWSKYLSSLKAPDKNPNTEDIKFIGRNLGVRLYYILQAYHIVPSWIPYLWGNVNYLILCDSSFFLFCWLAYFFHSANPVLRIKTRKKLKRKLKLLRPPLLSLLRQPPLPTLALRRKR